MAKKRPEPRVTRSKPAKARQADDVSIVAPSPKPGRPGGPAELPPERRAIFMKAMRSPGMSRDLAAQTAGVPPRTLYKWLARGKRTRNGKSADDEPYRQFRQEMLEAEAAAEAAALVLIAQAGQPRTVTKRRTGVGANGRAIDETVTERESGDWRALAWILERRKPKKYARRDTTTIKGDADAPIIFELDTGPPPRRNGDGEGSV